MESIEALEDAIERYEGTVLLVSHDRALLRALATRVWVLHDGRITDFHGTFEEWETRSAEREHAAAVTAAEDESLRRVREKQKVRRANHRDRDERRRQRSLEEALTRAESDVTRLEAEVERLTRELEDPALYTEVETAKRAAELGRMLDRARVDLDAALARWADASEALEAEREEPRGA